MSLLDKKDHEIFKIAEPIWDNLVKSSNMKDYGGFTKDFSSQMLYGANEVELGKQWAGNKLLTNLSLQKEFLGCLRRNGYGQCLISCLCLSVCFMFLCLSVFMSIAYAERIAAQAQRRAWCTVRIRWGGS